MDKAEKRRIESDFGRHVNAGQVRYLKSGHLDVLETRRSGVHFVDPESGRALIDAFTSAGCFNVGRRNPDILAALDAALDTLDMGTFELLSPAKIELARALTRLAPGDLNRVLFAAGGGDAIDCAIKLARGATGRAGIASTVKAYHGHTGLALSANGKKHYRWFCEPLDPAFTFVPFNDLDAMGAVVDENTAAVLVEPVQGEAGIFVGSGAYMRGLRRLCNEAGALLIFDEIQTGWGRTGKFFACEHAGVIPDIMTLAKSLGGGLFPNAAVVYRDTGRLTGFVDDCPDFHPSPAGGSDLGCRVSLAVIRFMEQNHLCDNAARMGGRLKGAIEDLARENPGLIREVRGTGLMIGLEYVHEFMGPMMSDALAKRSVFAAYSGNARQVMRFMVPITITDAEMDDLIAAISGALADMKRLLPLALPAAKIPGVLPLLNNERFQTWLFGLLRKFERAPREKDATGKGGPS